MKSCAFKSAIFRCLKIGIFVLNIIFVRIKQFFLAIVCALHKQRSHLVKVNEKIQKRKLEFRKATISVIIFTKGKSHLCAE